MAEDLQLVSKFLSQPPFKKKVSILDLDALAGPTGLHFLTDVFATLDPTFVSDVSEEEPQELAVRIFTFLRLLRYPPSTHPTEQSEWRRDVIEGKRRSIISVLVWLSQNLAMVQQRVYLAKYMTKVDVPSDFRTDPEINQILEEQDRAVAEFTATHKEHSVLKTDADVVNSLRKEIKELRAQKEQTEQRVAELVTRVRSIPGKTGEKEERMGLSRVLREEQENCAQLVRKRTELLQLGLSQNDQIARLTDYTSKLNDDWQDVTPGKLLQKLEDRVATQRRAVNEVLPRVIRDERKSLVELSELLKLPDFTERNLNELRIKAQMLQTEVFNMSDKLKSASQTPELAEVAAHQLQLDSILAKKTELAARSETLHRNIRDVERRMGRVSDVEGSTSLSRKLLSSAEDDERKRNSVEFLKVENRNASRTYSILSDEHQRVKNILTEWEKRTGMSVQPSSSAGPSETQAIGDGRALADQTRELEEKVASKRKEVSRLLGELQPIRQKHKTQLDIISKENQRQNTQDLQTDVGKVREEVAALNNTIISHQLEQQYADILLERAENESSGQKFMQATKTYIQNETSRLTKLRTEHETTKVSQAEVIRQVNVWKDLDRLFDMKMEHLKEEMEEVNGRTFMRGSKDSFDRIVMA